MRGRGEALIRAISRLGGFREERSPEVTVGRKFKPGFNGEMVRAQSRRVRTARARSTFMQMRIISV